MTSSRTLVTGGSGQLGRALRERLRAVGEVVASGRGEPAPSDSVVASRRAARVRLDLADPGSIVSALEEVRPTIVVNAAAYTAVDRAEEERELAFAVNAEGAGVLAEECARRDIPLVHFSTDYVFSGEGARPWRESDATGPLNVYGESKLRGERNVLAAHPAGAVVLRTSWVYSAAVGNFLTTMLSLGAERETLRVVDDQVGAPTSAPFLAEMTARMLQAGGAAGAPAGGTGPATSATSATAATSVREHAGLFHLCCAGETSWHGFAEEIFRRARGAGIALRVREVQAIPSAEYPTPARRPANSRLECGRFFEAFPFRQLPWEEALAGVIEEVARR